MGADALREAARRALEEVAEESADAEVTRVTLDVRLDGRSELVTLALRDGELAWTTSGEDAHVQAALRWLVGTREAKVRTADVEPAARVSWVPAEPEATGARGRLADALDDVVTVVVRAGIAGADSPSVTESFERLRREAPLPTPIGLGRWLGRLKAALDAEDVGLTARLLDGAAQLAEDLRRDRPSAEARRRVVGWMGTGTDIGAVTRVSDRVLVEVAREQLPSSERGGIERRHLIDLASGEVFREERTRVSPMASVGPCPRVVNVGLAEIEEGAAPRRIRMMQYAVSLDLGAAEIERIESNAYRRLSALAERYRAQSLESPGQAEPFAVVAPQSVRTDGGVVAHDQEGQPIPFARVDDPAAVELLGSVVSAAAGARWVAGRLTDVDGALMMIPCAVALAGGPGPRYVRLR